MLVREKNSIIEAITRSWNTIASQSTTAYQKEVEKIRHKYQKDPRLDSASDGLRTIGITNAEEIVKFLLSGSGLGYGTRAVFGSSGVMADMQAEIEAIPKPKNEDWYRDPSYSELDMALTLSRGKWDSVQTQVYVLIADMNSATTLDECRMAIRTFTKSLT